MHGGLENSRPDSPASFMTNSLDNATAHIDDLTDALANFSRLPSPEPQTALSCCCQNADCPNLNSWNDLKSRLESRLELSAGKSRWTLEILTLQLLMVCIEIGQALLHRYEAYVRRSEVMNSEMRCTLSVLNYRTRQDTSETLQSLSPPSRAIVKRTPTT